MARSLWICPRRAGPAAEERQGNDQGRQADRTTDRKGGGGGSGRATGRGRPQQAHQPMYPAVIRRKFPFALASKTGRGGRGRGEDIRFFFSPVVPRTAQHGRPEPLGVKGERVGVKWGGTGCATPDGPKWTAQSDDRWKVVGVVKVKMSVTQDGPKWTASSE